MSITTEVTSHTVCKIPFLSRHLERSPKGEVERSSHTYAFYREIPRLATLARDDECRGLSTEQVTHIAHLARIAANDEDIARYTKELSQIIAFVTQLNEVDTERVAPMTGGTLLCNVSRADADACDILEGRANELMDAAPKKKNRHIAVPSIF
jgi:aspartyl-tRNA(Asn)/glutamyl-tRNA(Gln) amidotransferase subunit C